MLVFEAKHLGDYKADACTGSTEESIDCNVGRDRVVLKVDNLIARGTVEEDPSNPEKKSTYQRDRGVTRSVLCVNVHVIDINQCPNVVFLQVLEL